MWFYGNMKKLSNKTVFMLLGTLVLIFVVVFGLKYWKSENEFTEVELLKEQIKNQEVGIADENSEVVSESEDIKEVPELSEEEKNEQAFQDFLKDIGGEEISEELFEEQIINTKNLFISTKLFLEEKVLLNKDASIIRIENCLLFKEKIISFNEVSAKELCDAPWTEIQGSGKEYKLVSNLDRYSVIKEQIFDSTYYLLIDKNNHTSFSMTGNMFYSLPISIDSYNFLISSGFYSYDSFNEEVFEIINMNTGKKYLNLTKWIATDLYQIGTGDILIRLGKNSGNSFEFDKSKFKYLKLDLSKIPELQNKNNE